MSVEIDPVELGFRRPFSVEVSQILKIRNPNPTPVAFKVKTTAPKQYCVRPNSGRIPAGREVEVSVLLQAMKTEPPLDAKCRDKFLVQSVAITADKEFDNQGSIWQHIDDTERSSIQEKKIRVVFLPAEGTAASTPLRNGFNSLTNGAHETPEPAPPAYRSPSPETFTPAQRISTPKASEDPKPNASIRDSLASATTAISNNTPGSYDELKAQLAQAQATIAAYGQEGGLKLRKAAVGESSNATVNEVANTLQGVQGVPVQIVAALCLFSFLLAYLFF
ncbi:hypothetical protein B7494_g223 [Chlorociboria aeruginascens]|nr:hypothetical protein B7494_g223 [Chlorociboria aeruginascens]